MELKNENAPKHNNVDQKKKNDHKPELKKKWLITAGGGMAIFGAGLCVFSEAAFAKHDGAGLGTWIGMGTLALILINTGLAIFGNAVVQKSYMESRKRLAKRGNNFNNRRKNYNKPKSKGPRPKNQGAEAKADS